VGLAAFALLRARAWHPADPLPSPSFVILDDFDSYHDTSTLRAAWQGGDASGDGRAAGFRLEREIRSGGRAALRVQLPAGERRRWKALRRATGEEIPGNWSGHRTFACMTRSLATGPDGAPLAAIGEIRDLGDYLYLVAEAPDLRTGLWRRVALEDERNRRYLSWSGWSRWQVDLKGDSAARGVDWSRVRAFRVAAAGTSPLPLFVYLDGCRLERAWRPVQSAEYFFLGVNIWDLWGRGEDPFQGMALREPFDENLRRDIVEKLAYLAEKRIPVLRVFLDYHFEIDPGNDLFEEKILERLDFVITTIHENGWPIRLIISHSTGFDLQTGLSWYARQAGGNATQKVRAFYTDPRLREIYKRQLEHVVEHINVITGVPWKDESVIWAWDVSNEPRILYGTPGTTYTSRTRDMVAWYAEMSGALRRLDPAHRIISGTFYGGDGIEPHDEDYDDWNIWELFTVDSIDALSVQSYVGPHLLRTGPKPTLLEEFGYGGRYFEDPTDQKRADNYRWMLLFGEKVYLSGVGALLWQMNWNHGYPDGKEIHGEPPATRFAFSPGARNRSLDVFEFYLAKYNRLEIEPEIEEGWSHLKGLRATWRSIHPPLTALPGERFGAGYVTTPEAGARQSFSQKLRALLGRLWFRLGGRGGVENRLFVPRAGRYRLQAWVRGGGAAPGLFRIRLDDGPAHPLEAPAGPGPEGGWHRLSLDPPWDLAYGKHVIRFELLSAGAALHRYRLVPLRPRGSAPGSP
jgi:hypothetical protein